MILLSVDPLSRNVRKSCPDSITQFVYAFQPDRLKMIDLQISCLLSSIADSGSFCMLHSSKGVFYHMLFTNQHQSCAHKA